MPGVSAIAVAECVLSSWSSGWQLTRALWSLGLLWLLADFTYSFSVLLLYLYRPKFLADTVFQYCDLNCVFLKDVFKS